jgi:hypothetical protein
MVLIRVESESRNWATTDTRANAAAAPPRLLLVLVRESVDAALPPGAERRLSARLLPAAPPRGLTGISRFVAAGPPRGEDGGGAEAAEVVVASIAETKGDERLRRLRCSYSNMRIRLELSNPPE